MAAISGKNAEWTGPGNLLGTYEMEVYQNNRLQSNFKDVTYSDKAFTVVWYYNPSDAEIAAGATTRQRTVESFDAGTGFLKVIGTMYRLRRDVKERGEFYSKGGFIPF